jgi:hypothetical protein
VSSRRVRHLSPVHRARERGQCRRALERGRREVLRRHHARAEVLDVLGELAPIERVRRLLLLHTPRGWEVRLREVLVWCGGRGA